jgi:hypothetical protein
MLEKRELFLLILWPRCEYTYSNTLRAIMPHCNMEPCAISRLQPAVPGRLTGPRSGIRGSRPCCPVAAAAMLSSLA